jgi:hypothetical protein
VTLSALPEGERRRAQVTTDAEGKFRFGGLEEKKYVLTVARSRDGHVLLEPVTAEAGKEDLKLRLDYGLTITGSVVDASGKAIPNTWINARSLEGGRSTSGRSAADGTFTLKGLSPGRVRLYIWTGSQQLQVDVRAGDQSIQIRAGRPARRHLVMRPLRPIC